MFKTKFVKYGLSNVLLGILCVQTLITVMLLATNLPYLPQEIEILQAYYTTTVEKVQSINKILNIAIPTGVCFILLIMFVTLLLLRYLSYSKYLKKYESSSDEEKQNLYLAFLNKNNKLETIFVSLYGILFGLGNIVIIIATKAAQNYFEYSEGTIINATEIIVISALFIVVSLVYLARLFIKNEFINTIINAVCTCLVFILLICSCVYLFNNYLSIIIIGSFFAVFVNITNLMFKNDKTITPTIEGSID